MTPHFCFTNVIVYSELTEGCLENMAGDRKSKGSMGCWALFKYRSVTGKSD